MNRKPAIFGAVVAIAVAAWLFLGPSPEEQVRRHIRAMAEDFNAGRTGPCSQGLSEDYRETTVGVDRQEIRGYLASLALPDLTQSKPFRYRVTLPEEFDVTIDPEDAKKATTEFIAVFGELSKEEWRDRWNVRINAEVVKIDGDWKVRRSSHETLKGSPMR